MTFTKVEVKKSGAPSKGSLAVRTFFEDGRENMGLENYGLVLHDGVYHEEQLACLERNGIKRYVTGLNEFAPEVKQLPADEQKAKAKEIRVMVAQLEKELAANILDPDDDQFWNKVKLLKPDNDEFWNNISMRMGNQPVFLDPESPYDLVKLYGIEAGGFPFVAPSYSAAKAMSNPPKFYLDKQEDTISTKNEYKKIRNKALAQLQQLYDKNTAKLTYVAKVIDPDSVQYRKSTPNDILYENMDGFINGEAFEKNKMRAATDFLKIAELDMEELKLRSLVKDASYHKLIAPKSDGIIYYLETATMLGRNPSDVVEFLKNPLNEEVYMTLMGKIEQYWNS